MIRFEKVSFEEFIKDPGFDTVLATKVGEIYDSIKLPERSTLLSAGYDFYAPFEMNIHAMSPSTAYPTGIRFVTDRDDIVLVCVPRSGLGFKHGLGLRNTVGIIDADYQNSDNEGHIKVKFRADTDVVIPQGKAFMQGIILPFLKTDDDTCMNTRNGGFGSTDKQN